MHKAIRILICYCCALMPLAAWAGPVDINSADAKTLAAELRGVGESTAQAIVAYRSANGPFKTVDDLRKVKGIGDRILEQNRANLRLAPDKPANEKQ
jgi:competence protein ComEA